MANIIKALSQWKEVLLITILMKISLFIISPVLSSWIQWDSPHYVDIAKNWYQTTGAPANFIVFYPLYPILIKFMNLVVGNFNLSAIIVSWIFSFLAAILLYELVLLDFNKRVAILSVWFMNIFPTAYFLQASYTESLFLTTSLACIYLTRKNLFPLSGVFGLFSSLTRINGIILIPLLLMESGKLVKSISAIFLTLTGFLIYLVINYLTFGDFFYFTKPLASYWYKHLNWPWVGISNGIHSIPKILDPNFYIYFAEIFTLIVLLLLTIIVFLKVRKSYGVYMFLNLLLFTSTNFILSTPRYSIILFPIFIALAKIRNKIILILVSFSFISLLIYFTSLYTQGKWAF